MAILLSWKSANVAENQIKIYRSDAGPVNASNLPQPIVTLAGDENQYEDNTVLGGKTYNYLIEVTNGTTRLYTATPSVLHIKTRGPGSSILLQGDHDCGYYGVVDLQQLPNMYDAFPHVALNITSVNTAPSKWHKFAWKGRILYIADRQFSNAHLNDAQTKRYLRSGLKYNFESENFKDDIPNIVSRNGYSFHARSIRSTPEDWDGTLPHDHEDVIKNPDTEFNQLLGSLWPVSPLVKRRLSKITSTVFYELATVMLADPYAAAIEPTMSARANRSTSRIVNASNRNTWLTSLHSGNISNFGNPFLDQHASANGWFGTGVSNTSGFIWPVMELIEGEANED